MSVGVVSEDGDSPPHRRLSCSCPFAPFGDGLPRLSFSYHKLPPHRLRLSVVKLDGGVFDVYVRGNATVRELKQAVEDVFAQSPKEGGGDISWSHVWWHFCLCYENQKLIDNKDYLKSFGIKDGDKLCFVRHLSINYNTPMRKSKRDKAAIKEQFMPCAGSDVSINEESGDSYRIRHHEDINDDLHKEASSDDLQEEASSDDLQEEASSDDLREEDSNGDPHEEDSHSDSYDADSKYHKNVSEGDENQIVHPQFKLAHFLRGWLSYSTLWSAGRTKSFRKVRPSRLSGQFLRLGSKMSLTRL